MNLHAENEDRIRLSVLGTFSLVLGDGRAIAISAKKNRALLAILALSDRGQINRERLCALLWGERGEDQARSSLRQSLAMLRKELGTAERMLIHTHDDIVLLKTASTCVDALEFLRQGKATEAGALRQAAVLYRGPLLEDTTVREAAYEDWLSAERRRFIDIAASVFEKLSAVEAGPAAVAAAKRLIELDPLREASHRTLMEAFCAAGENALALQQFEICRATLKGEFGIEPASETINLRDRIAKGRISTAASLATAPPEVQPVDRPVAESKPSIAVLPFTNIGGDPEQQYFSDGLTEDLITDLSKVPDVLVIAAHSALRFRGEHLDPAAAARILKVRYIVQGSVRRVPASIRINVKLIDAATGLVTWADRFDRNMEVIHQLQTEIARKIAGVLAGAAQTLVERYRPASLEAFDLVMRGRSAWRYSDEAGFQAIGLFERAIALESGYPEAHRWLAYGKTMGWLHFGEPMAPFRAGALAHARKAVELDPGEAANYSVLGFVLQNEKLVDDAEAALQTALRLNPNEADAWFNLSDLRVMEGKGEEALACSERSLLLNPQPNPSYYWLLGQAQIAAGQYEEAVRTLRREETYRTGSRRFLAAALALLGRLDEAREEGRLFMAANAHFRISYWVETQPFRDIAMRNKFVEAYHMAGLPD